MEQKHETREAWLMAAVKHLTESLFRKYTVPEIRVSVGWPKAARDKTIGQCFVSETAEDKSSNIFISPALDDPLEVLATLTHEMVHAVDDCKSGHGKGFAVIARDVGLTGKMTATVATEELKYEYLVPLSEELGEFPHAKMTLTKKVTQATYMLKIVSPVEPDFFLRMTQKKLDDFGFPRDPWGNEMELED
jgi:hypothetical protein